MTDDLRARIEAILNEDAGARYSRDSGKLVRALRAALAASGPADTDGDDGRPSIEELIERSSLGTPHAKALRESVSKEDAARIVARAGLDEWRAEREAVHADIVAILNALGIGDHARPYSTHEVVQREVLPAIRALVAAVSGQVDEPREDGLTPGPPRCRFGHYLWGDDPGCCCDERIKADPHGDCCPSLTEPREDGAR